MRGIIATGLCALALGLGTAACGSSEVKSSQISEPREKIAAAEEAGAKEIPKAAYHLKLAQDQLAKAEKLIKDGDTDRPRLMLQEASADAEVALAMARLETTRTKAKGALEDIQELRQEQQNP